MEFNFDEGYWHIPEKVKAETFTCWRCGNGVASEKAFISITNNAVSRSRIFVCPKCNAPNIFDDKRRQILRPLPGKSIKSLPLEIQTVYDEVRKCLQSGAFTGAVMLMRKIIMNIAVHEGAQNNLGFVQYVDYLCENGIVHKKSRKKAESVKDLGNDANHKIENRTEDEAKNCFEFIELLLLANYEFADGEIGNE